MCDKFLRKFDVQTSYKPIIFVVNNKFPWPTYHMIVRLTEELYCLNRKIERFSNECRKTKTKAITLTNHNRNKTQNEPIRNQIKYKQLVLSAGTRVQASHDWFWFYA